MTALGNTLREFKNLQNLSIWDDIIIGNQGAISLIYAISECTNLSSLTMVLNFKNQLNENDAVFSQLGKLKNLKNLKLFLVYFYNLKQHLIIKKFYQISYLYLNLYKNKIRKGFPLIHKYLEQINLLEKLDLIFSQQNQLDLENESLLNFGDSLEKCSNLKYLTLFFQNFNYNIDYQSFKVLAQELAQIQHLIVLNITMENTKKRKVSLKKYFIRKNKRLIKLYIGSIFSY
ncbi:hypothetical protein TTHERM_000086809 (macronuclear) [Tetrahymena thermophila SB210]|uniref:Uncharacterized protein n=1 Tax=Tetrahymena thermophila (strain SB210) TaxID=312017 RepID=W7XCM5_TETTS|nr:hypothetical protein TTHERM_000086809 [Tetrahymena thermophila SB210]EWS75222.1 hypothetical protein TTHERM_000086809 [Tetrahymena thermophila SB210]|eukprot:XP_012652213.1 hypothetical protein TTHERM_000086809 [Tetrahymena thermophila SB210]